MCSRFTLISKPVLVADHFGLSEIDDFPPRYNIAPTQPVGIVRIGTHGQREFSLVRWGLIPGWVKDPREFSTLINARAETLAQKPSFKNALKYRRCLFPLNGFYEWSGQKGARKPYYISRPEGDVFGIAGLWEHWMGADGSEMESAVIITTNANLDLSPIHHRMPVVIDPKDYEQWLDCGDGLAANIGSFLAPAQSKYFHLREVASKVNNPQNDGAALLEPVGQQELFEQGSKR